MRIKRNSWHSQIRNWGNDYLPYNDNRCRYCWVFAFNSFVILVFTAGIAGAVYQHFSNPFWISNSILFLFGCASVLLPILVISFVRKRLGHPLKLPKESLIIEYLKAKKDKLCPMIEYVD